MYHPPSKIDTVLHNCAIFANLRLKLWYMCLAACPWCWSRGWWPTSPSPSPPSTSTCWTSRRPTRTQRIRFTSIYNSRMPFLSRISNKIKLQWRFWSYLNTFTLLHWYFIFSVTPKLVDGFAWGLPSGALRKNARGVILCMYWNQLSLL